MEMLGKHLVMGEIVPTDEKQAIVWWRRAAAANVARAQCALGQVHRDGADGVEKNDAAAAAFFRSAADAGNPDAMFALGHLVGTGRGVPQDRAERFRLWLKAAEMGNSMAEANVARAYTFGDGVAQDFAAALRFSRRAADTGSFVGQTCLGVLYVQGLGVTRDVREGISWWEKAAAQGDKDAIENIRELAVGGSPEAAAALRRLRLAP